MTRIDIETVEDHLELMDTILDDDDEASASTYIMAGMVSVMDVNDYAFFNARGIRLIRAKSFENLPPDENEDTSNHDTSNHDTSNQDTSKQHSSNQHSSNKTSDETDSRTSL